MVNFSPSAAPQSIDEDGNPIDDLRCTWEEIGRRCNRRADYQFIGSSGPFVCRYHEERAARYVARALHEDTKAHLQREIETLRAEWKALQDILRHENSVIYYLQREDGKIKIGVSRTLQSRISSLENDEGPLRLLGLEYGGRTTEGIRHSQFRHLHSHGEWFEPGEELVDHCSRLAAESPAFEPLAAPMVGAPA